MNFPEFEIYQNRVLGAHILWEFAKAFHENSSKPDSQKLTIYHTLPILPLCFNQRVVDGIHSRNFKEGSLSKAIQDNKDIFSGLQERMQSMHQITLASLDISFKAGLLYLDRSNFTLLPNSLKVPEKFSKLLHLEYQNMVKASRRLGYWYSQLSFAEICMNFNIII